MLFLKSGWTTFRRLKAWLQILIVLMVLGIIGLIGASALSQSTSSSTSLGSNAAVSTNGPDSHIAVGGLTLAQLSKCGANQKTICKVGGVGPGGGTIFFVDYQDIYPGFNFLEAAPVSWGNGISVQSGETTGTASVDPKLKWCSKTSTLLGLNVWTKNAVVGVGNSNTEKAHLSCTSGAIQAAADYVSVIGGKTDWFLPSIGEAMLMYTSLRQHGLGGFASDIYWSSSETDANLAHDAWSQFFAYGYQYNYLKTNAIYVRPVRAFN